VPDNIVLIMRFHPVGGEDVTVVSEDFGGEREALEAIAQALDERRSLVLTQARYGREAGHSGVIINLANVVAVRVSKTDRAATGQYMLQLARRGGERSHLDLPQASAGSCTRRIADTLWVLDARVVAPGPEGCHRSQVGWASRFPENPQAICSCPRGLELPIPGEHRRARKGI
jgi:hypothetical protein